MSNKYARILPLFTWLAAAACGPTADSHDPDATAGAGDGAVLDGPVADAPVFVDIDGAPPVDAPPGTAYDDADLVDWDGGCTTGACTPATDFGCTGTEICDDGLDNDCDTQIDELCACTPGDVRPCFLGPPGKRNVGSCVDGTMRCEGSTEFNHWGDCSGGIWPSGEACDTQDNNCDGCVDNHPDCCEVALACPGPGDLPEASPFTNYVIDGGAFYSGPTTSWAWAVVGGPCDQLHASTVGKVSYTLTGATTPTVTFRPTLSGDYTFTVTIVASDGTVYTCTFIVHVRGPGLRVELCWDTTGDTDIDLHVHKPDSTTPFFTETTTGTTINSDDCYYYNCKAASYIPCTLPPAFCPDKAEWGYPTSPLAECVGGPEGSTWSTVGSCHNPRLDIDNISTEGVPENINIDRPVDGKSYRVMVHYYGGSATTKPLVNVYCGGSLLGTYGAAPDTVSGFNDGGGFGLGPMWRVVDVTTAVDGAGTTTGCTLNALHPPGTASGYWVTNDRREFSPP